MTERNILQSFMARFNPQKMIKKSIDWHKDELPEMKKKHSMIVDQLDNGGLSREDRSTQIDERNRLQKKIIFGDPGYLENKKLDKWIKKEKIGSDDFSPKDNRIAVLNTLNRQLIDKNSKIALNTRQTKGGVFVMSALNSAMYNSSTLRNKNSTTAINRNNRAKKEFEHVGEIFGLPSDYVAKVTTAIDIMSKDQGTISGASQQLDTIFEIEGEKFLQIEHNKILING